MPDTIRRVIDRFWALIDDDSVRPFIFLYYVPLLTFGLIAAVLLPVVQPIVLVALWVWVQIPATVSAMAGLALRHGGTPVDEMNTPSRRDWLGLIMQLGGHACMAVVLLAFELVAYDVAGEVATALPGPLGLLCQWMIYFAMAAISSYVIGCTLLSLQVGRKIRRAMQLRRHG